MPTDYRPRALICYPRRNLPEVRAVESLLEAAGVDTWRDQSDLRAGDLWDDAIARGVRRADVVLVFLGDRCPSPQQSIEIEAARKAGVPLIPVLLSDYSDSEPPPPLDALEAVDLRPGFGALVAGLASAIREVADTRGS